MSNGITVSAVRTALNDALSKQYQREGDMPFHASSLLGYLEFAPNSEFILSLTENLKEVIAKEEKKS